MDQLLGQYVIGVLVLLVVGLLERGADVELPLDLRGLDLVEDQVDQVRFEEELRVHVEVHVFGHLVLEVALESRP